MNQQLSTAVHRAVEGEYIPREEFKLTDKQLRAMDMLGSDATHCALGGGSRSGKTFLLVRAVLIRAIGAPESRHAIFRYRFNAIKSAIVYDTLPKVLKLCFPDLPSVDTMLNKTDWFLTLPNGSEIWFGGLDDKERTEKILGNEYVTMYFNECSQIPWQSIVLAQTRLAQKIFVKGTNRPLRLKFYYDFNPPSKKHWTYLRFIDRKDPITKQPEVYQANFGFYLLNPADNKENLSEEYMRILEALPEKARNRFLFGKFADDDEGALWTEETLALNRRLGQEGSLPNWLRVVIAVDPSGTKGDEDLRSDEIGIIVGALGTDGHGYVIEDLSGRYAPEEWADVVASAYERHMADRIVAEGNYGGDMVRAVIQAKDETLPFTQVTATRGKVVRAEPISSLYDQGMIHHVGYFPELEDQMCAMTVSGYMGLKSPDRADANVWLWTELFPKLTRKEESVNTALPKVKSTPRGSSRLDHRRT